jgi:hypothetical protein
MPQVRPEGAAEDWQPAQTFNLLSDASLPASTYAKFVVDTAGSLGHRDDKGFFRNQVQTHIAVALEVLREIGAEVTLDNIYNLLLNEDDLDEAVGDLSSRTTSPKARELLDHLKNRYRNQPPEQIGGGARDHRQLSAILSHAGYRQGVLFQPE